MDDFTPLHSAVLNNNIEAVELLISYKADLEVESTFGRRPLHIAAIKGYDEIIEILIFNKV